MIGCASMRDHSGSHAAAKTEKKERSQSRHAIEKDRVATHLNECPASAAVVDQRLATTGLIFPCHRRVELVVQRSSGVGYNQCRSSARLRMQSFGSESAGPAHHEQRKRAAFLRRKWRAAVARGPLQRQPRRPVLGREGSAKACLGAEQGSSKVQGRLMPRD